MGEPSRSYPAASISVTLTNGRRIKPSYSTAAAWAAPWCSPRPVAVGVSWEWLVSMSDVVAFGGVE